MNDTRKERSHKGIAERRKDTCLRAKQTKPWLIKLYSLKKKEEPTFTTLINTLNGDLTDNIIFNI